MFSISILLNISVAKLPSISLNFIYIVIYYMITVDICSGAFSILKFDSKKSFVFSDDVRFERFSFSFVEKNFVLPGVNMSLL
jgi:hypothetical protein